MLPHNHFIVADLAITVAVAVSYPQMPALELGQWILVGGIISAAIDLDIMTLVFLRSKKDGRLKPYKNPLKVYKKYQEFIAVLIETGLLKTGIITHLLLSAAIILFFYYFYNNLLMPVSIGVITHLLTDILIIRHLFKKNIK